VSISRGTKKTHIIITAGPTLEYIDPVRVITNRSTGVMGYEIAEEALRMGYKVTLITGPTHIKKPAKARVIHVETAEDMKKKVLMSVQRADILIMAAAVSDFYVEHKKNKKIKRKNGITLKLKKTPDILALVPKGKLKAKVGFALESSNLLENSRKKLISKGLDLIVANKVDDRKNPFGKGLKDFVIIGRNKHPLYIRKKSKKYVARAILDTVKKSVL